MFQEENNGNMHHFSLDIMTKNGGLVPRNSEYIVELLNFHLIALFKPKFRIISPNLNNS